MRYLVGPRFLGVPGHCGALARASDGTLMRLSLAITGKLA
jgi:hypothetical protein